MHRYGGIDLAAGLVLSFIGVGLLIAQLYRLARAKSPRPTRLNVMRSIFYLLYGLMIVSRYFDAPGQTSTRSEWFLKIALIFAAIFFVVLGVDALRNRLQRDESPTATNDGK